MANNYNVVENGEYSHKYWIDCLKFVACFLVFWGHFFEVFIYKNHCFANYEGLVRVVMKSVLNGNFWVAVFCIISGYCISSKKNNTFFDLIRYYIKRYFRFVLPLLLTLLFVIFLEMVVQYRTYEFNELLQGTWGGYYKLEDFSFVEYFKFVFLFCDTLDGPMWMIRPLFLSNCLLVTLSYFIQKVQKLYGKKEIIWIFVTAISLICFGAFTCFGTFNGILSQSIIKYLYVFISCLCGFCVKEANNNNRKRVFNCSKRGSLVVVISVFILLAFQDSLLLISTSLRNVLLIKLYSVWNIICGAVLFLGIRSIVVERDITNTVIKKIFKLSFPIYLLHWPVICSVGSAILLKAQSDLDKLSILLFVSINVVVVILSALYEMIYSQLLHFSRMKKSIKTSSH